ncbi:uncharacterized protein LOC135370869 isoform X2 [Ornithodoros turicata]|uniref:uncharacterized protein LOC135370869 isoform X2 n=1 Tax=Ornithodoros turicata TaxID=34597 RepID=UPI0031395167
MDSLLHLLQISDSAFPTGSFAHSSGLEAAVQRSFVSDKETITQFLYAILENTSSQMAPFVREARNSWPNFTEIVRLDRQLAATLNNHIARRASKQQGRSLVQTACAIYESGLLSELQELIYDEKIEAHQPIIYGALCAHLKISEESTLVSFLSSTLRNTMASAVRLGKVGPLEAQKMQYRLQQAIPAMLARNKERRAEAACCTFPLVDLLNSSHDLLFMRMFYS